MERDIFSIVYHAVRNGGQVQIDSRKVKAGDVFIGLAGKHCHGDAFIPEALTKGAAVAVGRQKYGQKDDSPRVYRVDDPLSFLQELAHLHRKQFKKDAVFIAVTGSNGKTTTKECIRCVLSSYYTCHATRGNWNNHIGVPLSLLSFPVHSAYNIIEMGANHCGEIRDYCQIAQPNYGVITNIGRAHIGEFGSQQHILRAKTELYDFLGTQPKGATFVCNDNEALIQRSAHLLQLTYGTDERAQVYATDIRTANEKLCARIHTANGDLSIATRLFGHYNLYNILCAVRVGVHFGVPLERIRQALNSYCPDPLRSAVLYIEGVRYVMDTYNANPSSMQLAINTFVREKTGKKVLILGGMKELGAYCRREHEAILKQIRQYDGWEAVILVGEEFAFAADEFAVFPRSEDAREFVKTLELTGCSVLVKGSRAYELEKTVGV